MKVCDNKIQWIGCSVLYRDEQEEITSPLGEKKKKIKSTFPVCLFSPAVRSLIGQFVGVCSVMRGNNSWTPPGGARHTQQMGGHAVPWTAVHRARRAEGEPHHVAAGAHLHSAVKSMWGTYCSHYAARGHARHKDEQHVYKVQRNLVFALLY